ncbi:MAG: DUF6350 family protein [Rhodoluna sp.]
MRIKAVIQGVTQTSLVIAVGYVSIFFLNMLSWLIEQNPGTTFNTVIQTTSRIWLNAHFVAIEILEGRVASVTVPGYQFTLVPLGFTAVIVYLSYRAGKYMANQQALGYSWLGAISSYGLVAFAATSVASSKQIKVQDVTGVFLPLVIFSLVLIISSLYSATEEEGALRLRIRESLAEMSKRFPWALKPVLSPALRAGTAVVLALAAVSAIACAVLIAINWVDAIKLYQGLQLSFMGTLIISFGQLALLPNLIIYGMSWFTGLGFSLGVGSTVSPLAVELGPLPAIPMLSALPAATDSLMIVFVLVILLSAFFATLLVKPFTGALRFDYASTTTAALSLGIGIGLVAALEMFFLAVISSGSIGPERMSQIGINPWLVFAVTFVEVSLISCLAAFFSARTEGVDTELVQRVRRLK